MSSYRTLFEIGKALIAESNIDRLLPQAMDQVIEQTQAERGLIIVYGDEGDIRFQAARHLDKKDLEHPDFEISRTIIQKVRASGEPVVVKNALGDPQFDQSESVTRLRLLSVACAPLRVKNEIFGVIYIDNRDLTAVFDEATGKLLGEFSDLIAVAVKNALDRKSLLDTKRVLLAERDESRGYGEIIGRSPAMQEVFNLVDKAAGLDITVLLTGETGTGKELVARELHRRSGRRDYELVALNCAATPENLLEDELFGHEKGAFTGADRRKPGWFEVANHGTLFLDEIGEMSLAMQAKLLRFMQSGEYSPLGAREIKHADVRLIAATNRQLAEMIEQKTFREDLFYRLNELEIKLPPLRERGDDMLLIADYFLGRHAKQFNKNVAGFSEEARALLLHHRWPGNVRELENRVKRAVVLAKDELISPEDFDLTAPNPPLSPSSSLQEPNFNFEKQNVIAAFEKEFLRKRLRETKGNISEAARRSGMHKKNFIQKMQQHGIKRDEFV
jgi:transcriptional regulator with GAF, ATPase, and Fis domain